MPKIVRIIINIVFAAALVAALAAAYIVGSVDRKPILCKGVKIVIADSTVNQFVTPEEVKKYIDKEYGGYVGMPIDDIDLVKVEAILDEKTAIYKSEAYTTKDSLLNISITQRRPIVRFQKGDKGFYADAEGFLFPLQSTYASYVQIIDGAIPLKNEHGYRGTPETDEEKLWLKRMIDLVKYIEGSRKWKDVIVQISVGEDGNLILVPRKGKEKFIFGHPTEIESKFEKMELYYKAIAPAKEEGRYRSVDLRFDGQIVCR